MHQNTNKATRRGNKTREIGGFLEFNDGLNSERPLLLLLRLFPFLVALFVLLNNGLAKVFLHTWSLQSCYPFFWCLRYVACHGFIDRNIIESIFISFTKYFNINFNLEGD